MAEECNHDCSSCSKDCSSRSMQVAPNPKSTIKKVIGVVSGKGGVGKSLVTSLLASKMQSKGFKSAILDADITGPSIPKMFGLVEKATGLSETEILPVKSKTGIQIISLNLLIDNDTDPVVWRGPVLAGIVKQFWTDVIWDNVDFMFVDMPPGTGDVPLTVYQSLPLDGIVIVTTPQDLVGMIVEKAVKMAEMLNLPILGIVENMSYYTCPECGKELHIFGESHWMEYIEQNKIDTVIKLPLDPKTALKCDEGKVEEVNNPYMDELIEKIISCPKVKHE